MEIVSKDEIEKLIRATQDNANPTTRDEAIRMLKKWTAAERAEVLKFDAGATAALKAYEEVHPEVA